ncbi:MAG: hypothetical protein R3E82_03710 [Pseudomonadales bacterium]
MNESDTDRELVVIGLGLLVIVILVSGYFVYEHIQDSIAADRRAQIEAAEDFETLLGFAGDERFDFYLRTKAAKRALEMLPAEGPWDEITDNRIERLRQLVLRSHLGSDILNSATALVSRTNQKVRDQSARDLFARLSHHLSDELPTQRQFSPREPVDLVLHVWQTVDGLGMRPDEYDIRPVESLRVPDIEDRWVGLMPFIYSTGTQIREATAEPGRVAVVAHIAVGRFSTAYYGCAMMECGGAYRHDGSIYIIDTATDRLIARKAGLTGPEPPPPHNECTYFGGAPSFHEYIRDCRQSGAYRDLCLEALANRERQERAFSGG